MTQYIKLPYRNRRGGDYADGVYTAESRVPSREPGDYANAGDGESMDKDVACYSIEEEDSLSHDITMLGCLSSTEKKSWHAAYEELEKAMLSLYKSVFREHSESQRGIRWKQRHFGHGRISTQSRRFQWQQTQKGSQYRWR
ncbi:hypothetical protein AU210_016265 [Fusarium oxysporum f. sp. radicis-cucumerinum]|uniref:Uncharacterized protein n=1 Tax=Fusarium oxysporum f. sp. radicis-cucumerinum TaxID=327505 RepID=A0A2H3G870_FUSOX|nr:hypothetical protein AU210_016265 [Fusarium oxysporum f. sp. radicis-cucumerinum]